MVRLLGLLVLAGLQTGSTNLNASVHPSPQDCGCPCLEVADSAIFRVWQRKDGAPDRFAAKTIGRWLKGSLDGGDLLILLGRSPRGIWALEASNGDDAIDTALTLTTNEGKRKVFPMIKNVERESVTSDVASDRELRRRQELREMARLQARVLRRLHSLAKSGQWDVDRLTPVQLPILSKPPSLVFREKGACDSDGYVWTLYVKAKDRRLVLIRRGGGGYSHHGYHYFCGAKDFAGVPDNVNGDTWWILVRTEGADSCFAEWHSIRLTHGAPPTK